MPNVAIYRAVNFEMNREASKGVLEGHAALYDTPALIGGVFEETIARGAFDRAIAENHDVRALINHDVNRIIGRTESKTLRLSLDDKGLAIRVELPNTSYGKDLEESIKRGDISQMSFGFVVTNDEWDFSGEVAKRTILDGKLFDVSAVTFPAYKETDIAARSENNDISTFEKQKEQFLIEQEKHNAAKRAARAKRLLKAYGLGKEQNV